MEVKKYYEMLSEKGREMLTVDNFNFHKVLADNVQFSSWMDVITSWKYYIQQQT